MNSIYKKVTDYFTAGHERSVRAKKNIVQLFLYKGLSVIITLMIVPIALDYLDPVRYGIWLTLSSIISWLTYFDVGLGNGLKNKFAEAKAKDNDELARIYVSTTYGVLTIIIILILLVFMVINVFLDWTKILNAPPELAGEINLLVIFVFVTFCISFVANLINTILTADQRPAASSLISLIANILSISFILLLNYGFKSSLLYAGIALSISTSLASVAASFYYFSNNYKIYKPSIKLIQWQFSKQLMNLGFKFFLIQISVIVIFSTDNIIITQFFGPSDVTVYNIAYKYFSVVIMLFGIILTPFWSAYTEAFTKNEIDWIREITKKLLKVWIFFAVLVLIMIVLSNVVYELWVGKEIIVPLSLSIVMGGYVLLLNLSNILTTFINGTGKIKIQTYLSVIIGIINIPIIIILVKFFHLGLTGVILGTCISLIPFLIVLPIQYSKILNAKALAVWNE